MASVLSDLPLSELLDEVAARRPAPGGGSSAAWSCGLGAALVAMAASFSVDTPGSDLRRDRMAQVHAEAERLRAAALELAERDVGSYAPVLDALRLPRDDLARSGDLRAALGRASELPMEIVRLGAMVAELAVEVAADGSAHLRGDALVGALLAEAGCRGAAGLVQINLRDVAPGDPRLGELEALIDRAAHARRAALA